MDLELTPTLIEWGCDAELWKETRNKQALLDLGEAGDEEKGKARIAFLQRAIEKAGTVATQSDFRPKGRMPEGLDLAAVESILLRRVEAKKARDFVAADALREEALQLGLLLNDRQRTFESVDGGFLPSGDLPQGLDVAAVDALLARRAAARKEMDYDTADALQAELKALGLYVDDKKRTYGTAK